MKTKNFSLAMMALAATALVGCGGNSEDNMPAATNSASGQPMPGGAASNNVSTPPAANGNDTNNPTPINPPATNNPPTGNTTN